MSELYQDNLGFQIPSSVCRSLYGSRYQRTIRAAPWIQCNITSSCKGAWCWYTSARASGTVWAVWGVNLGNCPPANIVADHYPAHSTAKGRGQNKQQGGTKVTKVPFVNVTRGLTELGANSQRIWSRVELDAL